MSAAVLSVLPFFAFAALGVFVARAARFTAANVAGLRAFVFYVAMPALLFSAVSELDFGADLPLSFAAAYAAASLLHFALAWTFARFVLGLRGGEAGGHGMVASVGNTTFLGFPLALALFGPDAAGAAVAALLIDNLLILPLAVGSLAAERPRAAIAAAVTVARNPIVLAAAFGLLAAALDWRAPAGLDQTLAMAAGGASAAGLFALGAALAVEARGLGGADWRRAGIASAQKLLVFPVLVLALSLAVGVGSQALLVGVLFAAAPTAVNVFVQASHYGVYARVATAAVALSTAAAAVTLSLFAGLTAG